ncbi:MAG: Uma2 family endonuclease [Firmicutes bacterium]|nr:Uma2 family endonuclease [Bacillota bacterium]
MTTGSCGSRCRRDAAGHGGGRAERTHPAALCCPTGRLGVGAIPAGGAEARLAGARASPPGAARVGGRGDRCVHLRHRPAEQALDSAQAGIPEYWVVDAERRAVTVHRLRGVYEATVLRAG